MTEEIKKILEEISNDENYSNFIDSQNGGAEYYLLLEKIEGKQLLNYITNLQQEINTYKEQLQNISNEFLKYDWEKSTKEQIVNQLKSLYNSIFKNGGDEE